MEASLCIVSRNRKDELYKTLQILQYYINSNKHEILVFLDGCSDNSKKLLVQFPEVKWEVSEERIGASPARRKLFAKAGGEFIFGFDDDAHPLHEDFIKEAIRLFVKEPNLAVISFEEIKGIFKSDTEAMTHHIEDHSYYCNSFVGCGFVIRKSAYQKISGFPQWLDIYGEEGCVSIQLIDKGYDILYTSLISVNHRVDRQKRKQGGNNAFRFERQLCNMGLYFLIYYPIQLIPKKLVKLFSHNFLKYGVSDWQFFKCYFKGLLIFFTKLPKAFFNRQEVSLKSIKRINQLPHPKYG
tara:strand:+ start:1457 stop:2347 length:891 start_codon:yes stop_codon:yes gene_type:complete